MYRVINYSKRSPLEALGFWNATLFNVTRCACLVALIIAAFTPANAQTTTNAVVNGGTISSGTTALVTNPTTAITGQITNNGEILFSVNGGSVSDPFRISGNGSLTQAGSGTLILTGDNNYQGGTTINANTLIQVGDGMGTNGQLGSGGVLVQGTLAYNHTNIFPESNSITGGGGVQVMGSGTIVMIGNSSFGGLTTIGTGATLQIGNGGTIGELGLGSGIINNGSIIYDRSDVFSESNVISGNGSLTQTGSGTLILAGANTYQGGTTINANTLIQVGTGSGTNGQLGSGGVTVHGTLIYDHSSSFTDVNVISGGGGIQQNGSGTLVLTASNNFNGSFIINAGSLKSMNNSALGSGSVTLAGGSLAPSGALNINSLNWNSGSLLMGLGTTNLSILTITAGLTNGGGGGTFSFYDSGGFALDSIYAIASWGSESGFTLNNFTGNSLNGIAPTFTTNNGTLSVEFQSVPEPSTYALLVIASLILVVAHRRRITNLFG